MSEFSSDSRELALQIAEIWAQLGKENQIKVDLMRSGLFSWMEKQTPAMQALLCGLKGAGLTIGEAVYQFQAASAERKALYQKLNIRASGLALRGWFLSAGLGMSDLMALAEVSDDATDAEFDAHVAALYRNDIVNLMGEILREYPERAFVLEPALNAHKRGEHSLSVPIFLSQADGITFQGSSHHLFTNKGKELRKVAVDELHALNAADPTPLSLLQMMMWLPLSEQLPLGYSCNDREKFQYDGFNRNTILHGVALSEYATEENSLKAFSLLSFVASLMLQLKATEF